MAEAGVPGHEVLEWNPILAPAGVAPAVRDKLIAAVTRAMGDVEVLARVRALGGEVYTGNPVQFLKAQQALWARVVKERGIVRD
jgi:tripartite-type tricarboxylate transporter receptor subunit TctC